MIASIRKFLFLLVLLLLAPFAVQAEHGVTDLVISPTFRPASDLEGRVAFWRLIFTKYGANQAVVHHRSHPELVYSVLDFTELKNRYSGRQFARKKSARIKAEVKRIRDSLRFLASGKEPRDKFERRVSAFMETLPGKARKKYLFAAEVKQVRSQTGIKERFRDGIRRSGRYLYAIEEIFRQAGLPLELSRLPLVESSFDYKAYSSKGAAGIWQFTRSTGKSYLRVNASIDDRRDPIAASRAAARYLAHAYKRLKAWPLAVTSYNHGISGVMRGVKQTGSRNIVDLIRRYKSRTFGFASGNFYAEFLAALEIEQNWRHYFPDLKIDEPWLFDEVKLERSLTYRQFLNGTKVAQGDFDRLNKGLMKPVRQGRVRIPKGYVVKVPRGAGTTVVAKLKSGSVYSLEAGTKEFEANLKKGIAHTGTYRVKRGETIGGIANRLKVSRRKLMALNGIRNPRRLRAGQKLKIPGTAAAQRSTRSKYTVKRGDNLTKIAKKVGVSVSRIRKLNPGMKSRIYPGQKIVVR